MIKQIIPKLPFRVKEQSKNFYINQLGFTEIADYGNYLIFEKDTLEIHLFLFEKLEVEQNYGQIYIRTLDIEEEYSSLINAGATIHPNGKLETKPWGQVEFSLLDPDHNLITFGQTTSS